MKIKELQRLFNHKFSIIEQIGNGGNATVYSVKNIDNNEIFALKVLNSECENFDKKRERFIIETNKVTEIQKDIKGIIPIIDFQLPDSSNNLYWYTMPIAKSINKYFGENRTILDIVKCINSLAHTLSILHDKEIVHRDIKPTNLYFYDGNFCLSDFGLVDYLGKKDITRTDEQVGAKATIAPEMIRDSKNSDAKKADVYSLSKTLWMLLTRSDFGFEGIYHPMSNEMGLKNYYKEDHLVELNQLIIDSTQDEPSLRPTMIEFIKRLSEFTMIYNNFEKRNLSEWNYVRDSLFKGSIPTSACWQNINDIINVLNLISSMPGINHMLFPGGGGLDLYSVSLSKYDNCIELNCSQFINIVSPKKLMLENIENDPNWSYFRLEINEIDRSGIFDDSHYEKFHEEEIIELKKDEFIHPKYWPYQHFNNKPFPKGTRKIIRVLRGSFVIFCKSSLYNHIPSTYDGRHNIMNSVEFREHVERLKFEHKYNLEHKEEIEENKEAEKLIKDDYYKKNMEIAIKQDNKIKDLFELYFKNFSFNVSKYAISDINSTESTRVYGINVNIKTFTFNSSSYRLKYDFYFRINMNIDDYRNSQNELKIKEDAIFESLVDVKRAIVTIQEQINKCPDLSQKLTFSIVCHRVYAPNHLFNIDELKDLLLAGDDSQCNVLVVDDNGYLELINPLKCETYELYSYPVRNETYGAGDNYVGKYTPLKDLEEDYLSNLKCWLEHLITNQSIYSDYYDRDKSEDELINDINQLINSKTNEYLWKKRY